MGDGMAPAGEAVPEPRRRTVYVIACPTPMTPFPLLIDSTGDLRSSGVTVAV